MQNFTKSPNQHNAKTLEKIMQDQLSHLPTQDSRAPVVDSDGFLLDDLQKAIQASLKSTEPKGHQQITQPQTPHLPKQDSGNPDGVTVLRQSQMAQASGISADSKGKQSPLKEKLYTCKESLRLFINTIGTSISNKFRSSPEKAAQVR